MDLLARAKNILSQEIEALQSISFGPEFATAVSLLLGLNGKLITNRSGYSSR